MSDLGTDQCARLGEEQYASLFAERRGRPGVGLTTAIRDQLGVAICGADKPFDFNQSK